MTSPFATRPLLGANGQSRRCHTGGFFFALPVSLLAPNVSACSAKFSSRPFTLDAMLPCPPAVPGEHRDAPFNEGVLRCRSRDCWYRRRS